MMKINLRAGFLSMSILLATSFAQAAMSGIFMVVKGDIKVSNKTGKTEVAKIGTKVSEGDTVQSGHDSRAKIVMEDKNVFNISPDSKMVIEKYQNDSNGKNVELKVEFGKVRASVEQKYDGDKSQFNVKTPTAVAGVRGTDFITGYNQMNHVSQIVTFSGMVAVGKIGPNGVIGTPVYVPAGHMTQIRDGKAPEPAKAVPSNDLKQMNSESKSASNGSMTGSAGDNGRAPASMGPATNAGTTTMLDPVTDLGPVAVQPARSPQSNGTQGTKPPPFVDLPKPPPPVAALPPPRGSAHIKVVISPQ